MTDETFNKARQISEELADLSTLQYATRDRYTIIYSDYRDMKAEFPIRKLDDAIVSEINTAINEVISKHRKSLEAEFESL